ncbi:Homeodomain-like protein [Coemansia spiralis]|nr:Homeodomain-like protein [Coemansia spiralis]
MLHCSHVIICCAFARKTSFITKFFVFYLIAASMQAFCVICFPCNFILAPPLACTLPLSAPMDVRGYPLAEYLSPAELDCCSILRLHPEQYLAIKHALVRAGRTLPPGTFKKRDAQKLCRVDVNKTSKVFEWFCKLGWIPHAAPKFGGYDHHNDDYD